VGFSITGAHADCLINGCAMSMGWQPVETAPRDGTHVLVTDGDIIEVCAWLEEKWKVCWDHADFSVGGIPTHWMPLPAQPNT
jgi:hypothetical protein